MPANVKVEPILPLYPEAIMIGAPVCKGQSKDGTQLGPEAIRNSGFIDEMKNIGVTVMDKGDVNFKTFDEENKPNEFKMRNFKTFVSATEAIANKVEELAKTKWQANVESKNGYLKIGPPVLIIGGDHSLATGSILGHKRVHPDACVIWVDAHPDLNTPMTSSSGWIHGMPLSFLMKELQVEVPYMKELDFVKPVLSAKDIAYIGLRDIDTHELYDMKQNGICHFTMHEVDRMGIETVLKEALEAVNPGLTRPIHLSFDIDVIDPAITPSTGTPVVGGLNIREAVRICEEVYATGKLSVVDLVELNPKLGNEEEKKKTIENSVLVLKTCLGFRRDGHLPTNVHRLQVEGIKSREHMLED